MSTVESKVREPGRIKSGILKWLGVPVSIFDTQFWAAWYGAQSNTGKVVTVDSALQLATVWACVRLIAETISTLPLKLYLKKGDVAEPAKDHPLYEVLRYSPNSYMTAVQFWEAIVASMLLQGMGYAEKRRVGARIVALDFLIPQRLTVRRLQFGDLEYRYVDLNGKTRIIPEDDIFPIPAFTLDGICGLSTIQYGVNVLGGAMAADEVAGKTFKNGLMSPYMFKIDRVVQKEQREAFRENLAAMGGALNAGKAPLLEAGMSVETLGINPDDAQLLESRAFSVEEICRWFRVPPFMVGHSEKSTSWGTGIEQQMIGFLTFTLQPWLSRIEQAVRRHLLTPAERSTYYAEFTIEGLLRADSAGRASFYSQMVQNGIYTRDDCRAKENLPRVGGNAAELTVQSNLLPIDQLGTQSQSDAAKLALRAWLNEEKANEPQERRDQGS
jgi:HK97 family phage portal protein